MKPVAAYRNASIMGGIAHSEYNFNKMHSIPLISGENLVREHLKPPV